MPAEWINNIAAYFDSAAVRYARSMEVAFGPLARELVEFAGINRHDLVLDLGTGTGLVAAEAEDRDGAATGIDLARNMLRAAKSRRISSLVQSDMHYLPFRSGTFSVVLASFALNSSDPRMAISEAYRVLRAEGLIAIQEWEAPDELSETFNDIFSEYNLDDPPPSLAALREQLGRPIPWDDVESVDELVKLIREAGFDSVEAVTTTSAIPMTVEEFLDYKLGWPLRVAEIEAMPDEIRRLCLSDLRENFAALEDGRGILKWQPNVVRIRARKPAGLT
jgi:ubiquinone/menaquinone biosynthesis C-methylase UbiE